MEANESKDGERLCATCSFVLIQKNQKIKTSTEMALEASLPCGNSENSLRSNSRNFFSQERPASTLRDGDFRKGRGIRKQGTESWFLSFPRSSFFSALLERDGPKDEKESAYVKKSICLSAASLMDFSKLTLFQVTWKTGLAFLVLLLR
jgi:hypothetical protein